MDLLVIGAGPVGRALAGGWSAVGHTVAVAVRDPAAAKHDAYRAEHRLVSTATLPTGDATVLAVPGEQLPALVEVSAPMLDGRLLVDATNTLHGPHLHQLPVLKQRLPNALVYRAFTSTGWEDFVREVAGERPDVLYAGPDGSARSVVEQLVVDIGPRPMWLGDTPDAADSLDAMAQLWFALALRRSLGRHLAVRILTGPAEAAAAPSATTGTPRHVTIVGRGRIATALGTAFARAGHAVTYAVRDPDVVGQPRATPGRTSVTDIATALPASEIVVLALPGPAVAGLVQDHRDALRDRLIIDAANVIAGGPSNSAAAVATISGARYARAFNSLGVENLHSPCFAGVPADMMFTAAGADRDLVTELVTAVGMRPVWLPEGSEEIIDDLLRLWLTLSRRYGRQLAFRVLTDNPEL